MKKALMSVVSIVVLLGMVGMASAFCNPNFETCPPQVSVPEPGTMLLLGLGLIGVAVIRRNFKD